MSKLDAHNSKAVKDFLSEAEEIIEQLGTELADLYDMAEGAELNPDIINSIFRGAHSLKGLAGMFGFSSVAELAHNMENLLDWLRLGKLDLSASLLKVLFESHELLNTMVRFLASGEEASLSKELAACVLKINACLTPPVTSELVCSIDSIGLTDNIRSSLTEYEEHRLTDNLAKGRAIYIVKTSFDLTVFDVELSSVTETLKGLGEVVSTLPSSGGVIETNIDFDILFASKIPYVELTNAICSDSVRIEKLSGDSFGNKSQAFITSVPEKTTPVYDQANRTALNPVPDKFSALLDEDQLPSAPLVSTQEEAAAASNIKSMSRTVRVDIGKLDELMNIVGELVVANSLISGISVRVRGEGYSQTAVDLSKAAKGLERKLNDLQKGVIEIRMIPIGQLYERMSRVVRKISRDQGKRVELLFFGADTELDKLIVEDLSDPMMHIIRNAIDHGIEPAEVREANGKNGKGIIRISSYQKGNHVVIEIEDDGGGIDVEKVKRKAFQKGLVADIANVSERDAIDFIFLPGFSTSETVSEISGRGVGMDVVKNNIAAISGMVDVETRKGKGSKFIITLPITLAIIKALIISCSGRVYALPITSVLESILVKTADIRTIERKEVIHLRESALPLLRLEHYFSISREFDPPEEFYVVVVGVAEKRLGLVVDDLVCQQDIVIKPLGDSFRRFKGISGAADLGDQRTILVLDIGGIINETMRSGS